MLVLKFDGVQQILKNLWFQREVGFKCLFVALRVQCEELSILEKSVYTIRLTVLIFCLTKIYFVIFLFCFIVQYCSFLVSCNLTKICLLPVKQTQERSKLIAMV